MIEAKTIDGIAYTPEVVEDLRKSAIEMRDAALKAGFHDWAVVLSHIVAVLGEYKENVAKGKQANRERDGL